MATRPAQPSSKDDSTASNERYLSHLEAETLRTTTPHALSDARTQELRQELHWCLTRNDWWFTGGGLVLGGLLSWMLRDVKPIAAAAILSPAADWGYSRHACAEYEEAYIQHKRLVKEELQRQAEDVRAQLRAYSTDAVDSTAGAAPSAGAAGASSSQQPGSGPAGASEQAPARKGWWPFGRGSKQ